VDETWYPTGLHRFTGTFPLVRTRGAELSVVVVAYHRPASLDRLLTALDGSETTLVVANVENDPEITTIARAHNTKVVGIDGNPGYAAAVNAGVGAVDTPLVAFSNDDVVIPAHSLDRLATYLSERSVQVVVPQVLDDHGSPLRSIQSAPNLRAFLLEWVLLPDSPLELPGIHAQKWREPTDPERIDAASAMVVMTRSDLLRHLPLPENYGLYWEESEWFYWLRESGCSVLYCPDATITNFGGRAVMYPDKCGLLAQNAVRYFRNTQGVPAALVAWPLAMAWQLRLVVTASVRVCLRREGSTKLLRCRVAGLRSAAQAWKEIQPYPRRQARHKCAGFGQRRP